MLLSTTFSWRDVFHPGTALYVNNQLSLTGIIRGCERLTPLDEAYRKVGRCEGLSPLPSCWDNAASCLAKNQSVTPGFSNAIVDTSELIGNNFGRSLTEWRLKKISWNFKLDLHKNVPHSVVWYSPVICCNIHSAAAVCVHCCYVLTSHRVAVFLLLYFAQCCNVLT